MAFATDEQTLNDLGIFGRRGGESVYGLFNRTVTRSGATLLEEMLRHPLPDASSIMRRSAILQYFRSQGSLFPFSVEGLENVEGYLSMTDERTRLTGDAQTIAGKMASLVAEDKEYKNIQKGLQSLMELLRQLRDLLQELRDPVPDAYKADVEAILAILSIEEVQMLLAEDIAGKLPYTRIVFYDGALRFRHRNSLRRLLQYLYVMDVYIAVARVASEKGFVFAEVLTQEGKGIHLEGVYHPLVPGAVPNTLDIIPENHILFLTGANMAGKSTFMKTLGIALFLAHAGFPVGARQMRFSILDGLYTTINLPDDLGMGASHFYAEVLRVKKVARELAQGKRLFVIFDELFRGTNVKDAYEATVALTAAFAMRRESFFVISTHIIEAGDVLTRQHSHIRPAYLPTRMEGGRPVYTYLLAEGITADRHGMVIINNEGIPALLGAGREHEARNRYEGDSGIFGSGPSATTFFVDEQTLDDLNLTGKYRTGSVYSLFNQVRTAGGERLLELIFHRPLCDETEINRRSRLWSYWRDKRADFPFSRAQLDRVEDYLHAGAAGSQIAAWTALLRLKVLEAAVKDERYSAIATGVADMILFIANCRRFFQQLDASAGPWAAEIREANAILGDSRLEHLPLARLSFPVVARHHYLLSHTLREPLGRLCALLYEFDLGIAIGKVAREKGLSFATALPSSVNLFSATGLRHPGMEGAIGNSMRFSHDSNVLFLTGANMAGKSTLMKSFGIAVYLAHLGFPVAAREMQFSVKEGLYSSINVPDDLSLGYSHFYAEVLRVKKVATAVSEGKRMVVIFDELFKGTNVKDAYDATLSVTEAFSGYQHCFFVISTHIIEVGETLQERCFNLQFAYLPTVMKGATPSYPYIIEKGITGDRHGMLIIRNEGILDILKST